MSNIYKLYNYRQIRLLWREHVKFVARFYKIVQVENNVGLIRYCT